MGKADQRELGSNPVEGPRFTSLRGVVLRSPEAHAREDRRKSSEFYGTDLAVLAGVGQGAAAIQLETRAPCEGLAEVLRLIPKLLHCRGE
eukprot:6199936-Alexandrium_andersonii.AAC.1